MSKLFKYFVFFVVLVAIFSLGIIFYQKEVKVPLKSQKIIGATIRPFALSTESVHGDPLTTIDQEMEFLLKLGANSVRFNDEPASGGPPPPLFSPPPQKKKTRARFFSKLPPRLF